MRIAMGDAVVLMDGDLQDPPELITQFVEKWQEGYDVVYEEAVRAEMRTMPRGTTADAAYLYHRYGLSDRHVADSALAALG
jgi:glycosyltransferase involved in cell wall biosynthesis